MGRKYIFGKRKGFSGSSKAAIALAFVVAVGILGFWPDQEAAPDDVAASAETKTARTEKQHETVPDDKRTEGDKNEVVLTEGKAYYLLKEAEGQIELYHYDEEGRERFIRVTEIPFSLISASDQEEFTQGVVLESEEALDGLLQDFES